VGDPTRPDRGATRNRRAPARHRRYAGDDPCRAVFGGTGFLGRRIVDALRARDLTVRVAARHSMSGGGAALDPRMPVQADLRDPGSVRAALDGPDAAVNAVSL
jgi:nucleoside-diphosphate-sugar epimerase